MRKLLCSTIDYLGVLNAEKQIKLIPTNFSTIIYEIEILEPTLINDERFVSIIKEFGSCYEKTKDEMSYRRLTKKEFKDWKKRLKSFSHYTYTIGYNDSVDDLKHIDIVCTTADSNKELKDISLFHSKKSGLNGIKECNDFYTNLIKEKLNVI